MAKKYNKTTVHIGKRSQLKTSKFNPLNQAKVFF